MFYKFGDFENSRLNRGVRGRLLEHCKFLMRERKLKLYDAEIIFENTRELPFEEDNATYYNATIDMKSSSDSEQEGDTDIKASTDSESQKGQISK